MLSISQAAQILGVNKKTLMRWDAEGKFPAQRDDTGARVYDETEVTHHAQWFKLRRKHRAHNRKLTDIRKEVDKHTATQPLDAPQPPRFHKLEDMKKAFDALHVWEEEHKEILKEYENLPDGFKAKVDPDA
jgi:DNA-binding transcriptional MerR regulator